MKSAWDDSDEEAEPPAASPASACAEAGAPMDEPAPEDASLREDPVLTDDHPATNEARLFYGCYRGSLRCVSTALAWGARADACLTHNVLEELETIACAAKGAAVVQAELGDSALHVAARRGEVACALLLLMQGGPPESMGRVNRRGESALDVASSPAIRELLRSSVAALQALELQKELVSGGGCVLTLGAGPPR